MPEVKASFPEQRPLFSLLFLMFFPSLALCVGLETAVFRLSREALDGAAELRRVDADDAGILAGGFGSNPCFVECREPAPGRAQGRNKHGVVLQRISAALAWDG